MAVTILIVDDDVTWRWLLCVQLDKLGLHAESAANGKEALERVKKWPYQVILMDLNMPEMDGYRASKAIRHREKELGQEPVPIIALSAEPDTEKCFESGITDYIKKPVDSASLQALLHKWMKPGAFRSP